MKPRIECKSICCSTLSLAFVLLLLANPRTVAGGSEFTDRFSADHPTVGKQQGIHWVNAIDGCGAVFSAADSSRIEYPGTIPSEGTIEVWINVASGYRYTNSVFTPNLNTAMIFSTDVQGGDVTWPGTTKLFVSSNGDLSFSMATSKYDKPPAEATVATATPFRFGEWHAIGISYGNRGQFIMLDGTVVAAAPGRTQILGSAGTHEQPVDIPTIGETVSHFWSFHRYEGGFEGIVAKFRVSTEQQDWKLAEGVGRGDTSKFGRLLASLVGPARRLAGSINSALERVSGKTGAIYEKDGFVWMVDALRGGTPAKLWPEQVESFTVAANGLVALEPKSDDPLEGDIIVISAASPGKAVVALPKTGYQPTISPSGTLLAYVRPLERFSRAETEQLAEPTYCVLCIFVAQSQGGVFEKMAAQQKLETIKQELGSGADFEAVARRYSDEAGGFGMNCGCSQPKDFGQGFGSALGDHHKGDTFGPVKTAKGWYFLHVSDVIAAASHKKVYAKRTAIMVRNITTGTEVEVDRKAAGQDSHWSDDLRHGWGAGGRALRIGNFSGGPEDETRLWNPTRGELGYGEDVMADGGLVRVDLSGGLNEVVDPQTHRARLSLGQVSGGAFCLSPSRSKIAFCVKRDNGVRGPFSAQLRVFAGEGDPTLLDTVQGAQDEKIAGIGPICWLDENRLVYEKQSSAQAEPELWTTQLTPGSAREITVGSRPQCLPGNTAMIAFARGSGKGMQWWSSKVDGSKAIELVDGVEDLHVMRVVRLGSGVRHAVAYGVVGVIGLLVAAGLAVGVVVVGKRVRHVIASRPQVAKAGKASPARFCRQCGAELAAGVRFCQKCGKPLQ